MLDPTEALARATEAVQGFADQWKATGSDHHYNHSLCGPSCPFHAAMSRNGLPDVTVTPQSERFDGHPLDRKPRTFTIVKGGTYTLKTYNGKWSSTVEVVRIYRSPGLDKLMVSYRRFNKRRNAWNKALLRDSATVFATMASR